MTWKERIFWYLTIGFAASMCFAAPSRDELADWAPTSDFFVRKCGLISYNGMTRTGRWALERIDRNTQHGDRSGLSFHADADVPDEFNATPKSYAGSGFDIGHLIASADDDGDAQKQTFTTANACPETPKMNRGAMAHCEKLCRTLAEQLGVKHVLIYTVPVWLPGQQKIYRFRAIGDSRIWVPTHVVKVAGVFKTDGQVDLFAWRIPNDDDSINLDEARITVDEAESDAGLDFFKAMAKAQQDKLESKK